MLKKCPNCDGTGIDPVTHVGRCQRCNGTGRAEEIRIPCTFCRGRGSFVPDGIGNTKLVDCPYCEGKGYKAY